ncbi:ribosomal subunit interface protein [Candidatus Uhrbacteria bacterium CG10_big_fil_rev_8_21_14_0_10_48_16]|uniref:Ribosomal subunit interface protein n=1 Tax=Candidatus Uhrbacteria bacterium CG10_big_fil_rev_8_21_14_0_10_48_16 TaxID=1975038 RepID=A0A2M8LGE3_9BACT|nr:MAG: ribosomal subunit interface protein [Candidatus Uhrbacteria bacterium CG10_big_fil_rev_8_21_14_0_10_48_16]
MRIISIKGTNIPLTDAIKSRVISQSQALERLTKGFEPTAELRVEVGKSTKHHLKGPYYKAEFQLHVPGSELRATTEEEDLYHAIVVARDQIRRQLKGYKDKLTDKHKRAERPDKK